MNIEHKCSLGDFIDLTVTCDYTPGTESQCSGPPEMCFEGEPSVVEFMKVYVGDTEISSELSDDQLEEIQQDVIDNYEPEDDI